METEKTERNPRGAGRKPLNFSKKKVIEAMKDSGGIVSAVARRLGCDWTTADKYIKKFGLDEQIRQEKEALIDMAESKLLSNIKAGDNVAILFFLKTQAKHRGYIEKVQSDIDVTTKGESMNKGFYDFLQANNTIGDDSEVAGGDEFPTE